MIKLILTDTLFDSVTLEVRALTGIDQTLTSIVGGVHLGDYAYTHLGHFLVSELLIAKYRYEFN